tara:strand:- start:1429 stop:1668 length:240 start_codon:yes stop_codon:yes gene_type:complete
MKSAKRQPTFYEVKKVVDANPDKVDSFMKVGKNSYVMNKGRYNGLGIIFVLDFDEYEKFTMYRATNTTKTTKARTYKSE